MICYVGPFEGEMVYIVSVETSSSEQIPFRPAWLAPGQRPPTHPEDAGYKAAGPPQPRLRVEGSSSLGEGTGVRRQSGRPCENHFGSSPWIEGHGL